jgi:uncharacterized C2H2 Zn-finger protein
MTWHFKLPFTAEKQYELYFDCARCRKWWKTQSHTCVEVTMKCPRCGRICPPYRYFNRQGPFAK